MISHKVFVNQMHSSILLKQLATMWRREVMCDAVLIHDHGTVKVHKVILTAACGSSLGTDQELTIQAPPGVKKESLLDALTFLYDGVLTLTNENFSDIWKIASALKIEELRKCCIKFAECYKQDFRIDLIRVIEQTDSAVTNYSVSDEFMSHIIIVDVTRLSQPKLAQNSSASQETHPGVESREGQSSSCITFELQDDFSLKAVAEATELSFLPDKIVESDDFAMDEPESDDNTQILTPINTADTHLSTEVKQEPPDSYQQSSINTHTDSSENQHIDTTDNTGIMEVNGSPVNYKCSKCRKSFTNNFNLGRHIKLQHEFGPHIHCKICSKFFDRVDALNHHISTKHDEAVLCEICGKVLSHTTNYDSHMATHIGRKKRFICPFEKCKKSNDIKQRLQHHCHLHTGTFPYKCEACEKSFANLYKRNEHQRICKGEKSKAMCSLCDKHFSDSTSLRRHMKSSHEGASFRCVCGKDFRHDTSLNRHKKTFGH